MKKKLLMISHMSWNRNLGATRTQIELSNILEKKNFKISKFDLDDAYKKKNLSNITKILKNIIFPIKVHFYLKKNIHKFDYIDYFCGNVIFPKKYYKFNGKFICRITGWIDFFNKYNEFKIFRKIIYIFISFLEKLFIYKSLNVADVIHTSDKESLKLLKKKYNYKKKIFLLHNGLKSNNFKKLNLVKGFANKKLAIVFIGSWINRKGIDDLKNIISQIENNNIKKYKFLATRKKKSLILKKFPKYLRKKIFVFPEYKNDNTYKLLSDCSIGFSTSRAEGFGLGTLEMLAAGIPVIGYNVPGSSEILSDLQKNYNSLIKPFNIKKFIKSYKKLTMLNLNQKISLSKICKAHARKFNWNDIANRYIEIIN